MLQKLGNNNGSGESSVTNKKIEDLQKEVNQIEDNVTSLAGDVAENASDISALQACVAGGTFANNISGETIEARNGVVTDLMAPNVCSCIKICGGIDTPNVKAQNVNANNLTVNNVPFTDTLADINCAKNDAVTAKTDAQNAVSCAGAVQADLDNYKDQIACNITSEYAEIDSAIIDNISSNDANITKATIHEIENDIIDSRALINKDSGFFEPTAKDASEFYHIHLPTKFQGRARFVGVDANGEQQFSAIFDTSFSNRIGNDREGTALVVHSGVTKWEFYKVCRRKDRDQLSFITQASVTRVYYHYDNLDKTDVPTYDILADLTPANFDETFYNTIYTAEHSDQVVVLGNEDTLNGGLTVFGTFYASAFEIPETEVANVRVKHQIYGGYDCDTGEYETCGTPGGLITYNQRTSSGECNVSWINGCPRQIVRKGVCYDQDGYGNECSYLQFEDVIHEDTEYNPDDSSDKTFDETSLAHYSGKTCTCQYPIVHLGDCTCVHGKVRTETDVEVCGKVLTCHICSEDNLTITTDCDFTNCVKGTHRENNDGDKYTYTCGDSTTNIAGDSVTVVDGDSIERIDAGAKRIYACESVEAITADKCVSAANVSFSACEVITNNACCSYNINAPVTNISCTTNVDFLKVKCCVDGRLEVNGDVRAHGQLIAEGDAVVHGDLLVEGSVTTNCQKEVTSTGNYITLREGNNAPLQSTEYSGIVVNNYASNCMATLAADYCGEWRVSDSATTSACHYTDISNYNTGWYSCLTQTAVTVCDGIHKNAQFVELSDVALDSNNDYYDHNGADWYGPLSIVNGKFDLGSLVTDPVKIAELEALTTHSLVYYNVLDTVQIDPSTNQPLLTREEKTDLHDNDILVWDCANSKATNATRPTQNNTVLTAQIDSLTGCVDYAWKSGGSGAICCYPSRACANAAILIQEGCDGYVPDNAQIIIENEVNYILGETR